MSDLLDLKFFIGSLIRPLIKEAVAEALEGKVFPQQLAAPVDEILTIDQAAEFLNLTKQTIYSLVSSGKIPYSKPTGSRLYFSRLALIQWLNDNRKAPISDQAAQYEAARLTRRKSANPQNRKAA
ncbi:helix-turn-helix domain-containing protein [Fibrella sp. USSR17]